MLKAAKETLREDPRKILMCFCNKELIKLLTLWIKYTQNLKNTKTKLKNKRELQNKIQPQIRKKVTVDKNKTWEK